MYECVGSIIMLDQDEPIWLVINCYVMNNRLSSKSSFRFRNHIECEVLRRIDCVVIFLYVSEQYFHDMTLKLPVAK